MSRALVVIDVQNDYFPEGYLPLADAEAVEGRIVAAISAAREAGDRIILVRHDSGAGEELFGTGTPGAAIRPAILAAAGDVPVVVKTYADAFQDTDLATHLQGVEQLILCGMMTQNCVVFTALSPAAQAFEVTVASDLCAAPTELVHLFALDGLSARVRVLPAAEI